MEKTLIEKLHERQKEHLEERNIALAAAVLLMRAEHYRLLASQQVEIAHKVSRSAMILEEMSSQEHQAQRDYLDANPG